MKTATSFWSTGPEGLRSPTCKPLEILLVRAQIAMLIKFLISTNAGSPDLADRFYIVGFSLGSQIAGYAGTNLRGHGMMLGRITGTHVA